MSNRGMKDSGIEWMGEIPEIWEINNTKFVFQSITEKNNPIKSNEVLSLLKDVGVIRYSDKGDIGNKCSEDITRYHVVRKNDIVMNSMNVIIGSVGKSDYDGVLSPVYHVLRIRNQGQNDVDYFDFLFKTREFQRSLRGYGNGILEHRMRIPISNLNKVKLPLPPLHEQQAIATYLDEQVARLDQLIRDQQQVIEDWKSYKQSLITETVTKGLDPEVEMKDSGIEWIGEIPSHWEVSKIKYVSNLNEKNLSDKTNPNYCFRYVDIGSVNLIDGISRYENFSFHNAPSRARRVVSKGDVIVSTVRTYLKAIAVIEEDENVIVSTGFAVITPKKVNRIYLGYFLKSEPFIHNVNANSTGVNYPSITSAKIASMELNIPPLHEQQQIADFLDEKCSKIDRLIEDKQRLIEDLKAYKQSLIYECVTGKKEIV